MSKVSWALTCSMVSLCGFLFLFLVGILVQVQPKYMKIHKSVKSPTPIFESACLYGTLFLVSSMVYYKETKKDTRTNYDLRSSTLDERQCLLDK
ncbi:unnamed protein product [Peronospora farinosa]|nr:unnamed protein product [Peronospora farinosa]